MVAHYPNTPQFAGVPLCNCNLYKYLYFIFLYVYIISLVVICFKQMFQCHGGYHILNV